MKRFFTVVFLLAVIVVTFSVIILTTLARGAEDNFFNTKYRAQTSQYPMLRLLLSLRNSGDGKSDYLGDRYNKIIIEIDKMSGLEIPAESLDSLVQKISKVTGKEAKYVISDRDIPNLEISDDEQIAEMVKQHRDFSGSDEAMIYLLYLNEYSESNTQIGLTYKEFGIVLFDSVLKNFLRYRPESYTNFIESTALHEFGHQLGLEHNDMAGCLMQPIAHDYDLWGDTDGVVTDFCDYEKQQLQK